MASAIVKDFVEVINETSDTKGELRDDEKTEDLSFIPAETGTIADGDIRAEQKPGFSYKDAWTAFKSHPAFAHLLICIEFFAFKIVLLTLDVGTDFATASDHFYSNNPNWGLLTLLPIFLPVLAKMTSVVYESITNCFGSLCIKIEKSNENTTVREVLVQLPVVQTLRNIRLFFGICFLETTVPQNLVLLEKMKLEAADSAMLEAFLESAPQFILQSYIILQTGKMSYSQYVGVPISFLSLLNSSILMFFTQRIGKYAEPNPPLTMKLMVAPFMLLKLAGPMYSLVLLAIYLREYFPLCILVIVVINFTIARCLTRNNFQFEKLYPQSNRFIRQCIKDKDNIVNSSAFTSWISPCSVLSRNFKCKTNFLLVCSFICQLCQMVCISAIFVLLSVDANFKWPLIHCTTEKHLSTKNLTMLKQSNLTFLLQNILIVQQCPQGENDCDRFLKICSENEQPTDLFFLYLGPIAFTLLLLSVEASICLNCLGDNETIYRWSKMICCNKGIVHFTLIQDWIYKGNVEQVLSVKEQLTSELINRCDTVEKRTCLHYAARATETELSDEILKELILLGGNETVKDIFLSSPLNYMKSGQQEMLKMMKEDPSVEVKLRRVWNNYSLHQMCNKKMTVLFTLSYALGGVLDCTDENGTLLSHFLFQWLEDLADEDQQNRFTHYWIICIKFIIWATDEYSKTMVHFAASLGCKNLLKLLLSKEKSVDILNKFGQAPLVYASQNGHVECLRLLLENGASVDRKDNDGFGAIHFASGYGQKECLKLLLQFGSDVNLLDKNGNTPMHRVGHDPGFSGSVDDAEECCILLLEAGADLSIKNSWNQTPTEWNKYLIGLILKHMRIDSSYDQKN